MTELSPTNLAAADESLVAEELALHERVKQAVRTEALAKAPDIAGGVQERLKELRDEAITASERDLPALFQQLYTHHSLAARNFDKKLPDMRSPYFARVRLVEKGKARDVLIGHQTFIDSKSGVTIIDWRHAALAKVFFNFREGDEYELELPGRLASGTLAVRRVLAFEMGELVGITGPDFSLVRERGGAWRRLGGSAVPELAGGAGTAISANQLGSLLAARKLPDVSALLDVNQYEILNREDQDALLILGGAGSGKTTIALHRMALLNYRRPKFYSQDQMKVVVPEQGLVRFTQRLLGSLQLDRISVETFDGWVMDQARHILKGLPKKLCEWTSSTVIAIKRHPAVFALLDAYEQLVTGRIVERLRFLFDSTPGIVDEFAASRATPLAVRLDRVEERLMATLAAEGEDWRRMNIQAFLKEARAKLNDVEGVRSELYTHPDLLAALRAAGQGEISDSALAELSRHTRRQFEEPAGKQLDAVQRQTKEIDGADLQEDDYAGTIDVEDYAILLNWLDRVYGRVARKGKSLTLYKHLVIDEAQDVAQLEHRLLGQALNQDGTLTVAGDAAQQSDPTVVFRGWDDVLAQLGADGVEEARLTTNYRCPRPVAEFAHAVLGPLAPASLPTSVRDGLAVAESRFPNDGLAVVALSDALGKLFERERLASVAVICANEENARRWYDSLRNLDDVRLVVDGEFAFKPGIDVTDVSQIKGLEFDYVIIPDADEASYPDTPVARRTLHIAATRAVHQLWVVSVGRRSPILSFATS
jgi:DNA helicase-2/ATP-dependent DNA helicase PcrA